MLDVSELRHQALASNLANAQTQGYKRVDVSADFSNQLRSAVQSGDASQIKSLNARIEVDSTAGSARADGSNVEMDKELMEISNNALNFEFLTQYMTGNYTQLKTAISGRVD